MTIDNVTGTYNPVTGNYTDPGVAQVQNNTSYYFAGVQKTGTYDPIAGNYTDPGVGHVQSGTTYKFAGTTQTGTMALAAQSSVDAIAATTAKVDAMLEAAGASWRFTAAAVAGVFLVDLADVQDAAPNDSLATMCLAGLHSGVSGTTWTIRKTDGTTKLAKTVTPRWGPRRSWA